MDTLGDGDGGDSARESPLPLTAVLNDAPPRSVTGSPAETGSPWRKSPPVEPTPPSEPIDGVVSITIPEEILTDPNPLWRCYVVGYFIGDAPHVGSIHATVNRLWSSPKMGSKIDVQFLDKTTILFRIENPQMRARVLQRRYWHIADIPLVVNEWSPETALDPPDLSAMPIWIDLKGVPSLLFSHKALKCLSRATGKFVKLHPHTEKFTRLDVARVLVEVNLNKPLVEKISCLDKDGATVMIEVYYPWLPPKCSICNAWGNQGSNCKSKRITMLQKDKEVEVPKEDEVVGDVVITGDGIVRYDLNTNRNVVTELLQELEGLPPALGSNVVGDVSQEAFEKGNTSHSAGLEVATQDWALVGRIDPNLVVSEVPKAVEGLDGALGRNDVVISPSRFSVLALEEIEEDGANEEEDLEEGEVVADFPIEETKMKDPARTGRFRPGPSLKLSKQLPARSKDLKVKTQTCSKKTSSRKL